MSELMYDALISRPLQIDRDQTYELPVTLTDRGARKVTFDRLERLRLLTHRPSLACGPRHKCLIHLHPQKIFGFMCPGSELEFWTWAYAELLNTVLCVDVDIVFANDKMSALERELFTCQAAA